MDIEKLNELLQTEPPDYKAIKNALFNAIDAIMKIPKIKDLVTQFVVLIEALEESDENLFIDIIPKMKWVGNQENSKED